MPFVMGAAAISAGVGLYNMHRQRRTQEKTWQREDTAAQRRVADLQQAGLSPTLAAGSAAEAKQTDPGQMTDPQPLEKAVMNAGRKEKEAHTSVLDEQKKNLQIDAVYKNEMVEHQRLNNWRTQRDNAILDLLPNVPSWAHDGRVVAAGVLKGIWDEHGGTIAETIGQLGRDFMTGVRTFEETAAELGKKIGDLPGKVHDAGMEYLETLMKFGRTDEELRDLEEQDPRRAPVAPEDRPSFFHGVRPH